MKADVQIDKLIEAVKPKIKSVMKTGKCQYFLVEVKQSKITLHQTNGNQPIKMWENSQ